jgi:ABC-2 type transport system ATP-binding protein
MTDEPVIQTHRLSKAYGRTEAVRDLSLQVGGNRITGFLGRNGAGKSTTIKMLLGMLRPTSGSGHVLGKGIDDAAESVELRRHVAYVSEDKRLYPYMTVEQIIHFTGSFYDDWRQPVAEELLKRYDLPRGRRVKSLSKGMRTKLALLLALARRPGLLILDEPSEGLDPVGVEQLLEGLVSSSAEGTAVFFSSHQIEEVERIADQVCILDQGTLLMDQSMDEVRESYRRIDLVFPFEPGTLEFGMAGVESVCRKGHQISLFASGNVEQIVARARSYQANEIDVSPISLREIFLRTIQEGSHALV